MLMTIVMSLLAYKHWSQVQKAMRRSAALPASPMMVPVAGMLIAAAISCIMYILFFK